MSTPEEQILEIEKEIRETPYNKSTQRHIGMLRAKIARLKDRQIEAASRKSGGGGGYAVKKQGDATVVLVGPPSAGKSTLINKLTNAESKVAPYAFTTVTVIPGMLKYQNAYIQILDVPGLIEGAQAGKGRGKEVLSVVRGADLLIMITDVKRVGLIEKMVNELEQAGIRINKVPPQVRVEKKPGGGILVHTNIVQEFDKEAIADIASEYGVKNGEITIKEKLSFETLVDAFSPNRVYVPAIYVVNKVDLLKKSIQKESDNLYISADQDQGVEELKQIMWKRLNFVRIYLVRPNQDPNYENPMVMKKGDTLEDVANKIGTEFFQAKSKAKIWGSGARYAGQEVSLKIKVEEGMQVRFI